jgi:hypothetical protein
MQRFTARKREEHYDQNKRKIDRLFMAFRVASVAIGVEVELWALELA